MHEMASLWWCGGDSTSLSEDVAVRTRELWDSDVLGTDRPTLPHTHTHSLSYLNGFDQREACARNSSIPFDKKLQVNRTGEQSLSSTKT